MLALALGSDPTFLPISGDDSKTNMDCSIRDTVWLIGSRRISVGRKFLMNPSYFRGVCRPSGNMRLSGVIFGLVKYDMNRGAIDGAAVLNSGVYLWSLITTSCWPTPTCPSLQRQRELLMLVELTAALSYLANLVLFLRTRAQGAVTETCGVQNTSIRRQSLVPVTDQAWPAVAFLY